MSNTEAPPLEEAQRHFSPAVASCKRQQGSSGRTTFVVFLILAVLLGGLQYRLWSDGGSFAQINQLKAQIAAQHSESERLLERNRVLDAEVVELKKGMETIEERARHELGMVKDGETLYLLTP